MTPHILCIVGKKKSGKTTFMEKLLPELRKLGLSVGAVKHDAHSFEIDHEGKDSWRLKQAGAETVVVSSPERVAMIRTVKREQTLEELAEDLFRDKDLVLAEGYFNSPHPKIEVYRREAHDRPLCDRGNQGDRKLIAMVTDRGVDADVPKFGLDDAHEVAAHVARKYFGWVNSGMWATHD
ncbi:MAG: molybdopterin-guanine dinucleotide biosynthesis protein B [Pseudodesulfovibrio sp.]|jgi:molybdopterin-guanine dinucleotide biosynthesis protein B|uniref:Molybdopterin guanine dinucleotide biosynthesis accessory protein MobB n=1 Tax=Pseudodesulfovibrio indicus TaxID=1716143 RepID=A0A126QK09_9BACT|nr:molybdopterin-guanine dinucleotide biosynthesis protein B [Pseudodesulfovibrio indicus]AMK10311.1 molybdopterin-guanine dinucleotide biosynthesis protein MobB [Pseudodesulfovibrio indicus]TDT81982.1 molybdopterin guanine dinucleotide biosynthesis accessory protein MobB [Pseudodesulfovibrio indicus]